MLPNKAWLEPRPGADQGPTTGTPSVPPPPAVLQHPHPTGHPPAPHAFCPHTSLPSHVTDSATSARLQQWLFDELTHSIPPTVLPFHLVVSPLITLFSSNSRPRTSCHSPLRCLIHDFSTPLQVARTPPSLPPSHPGAPRVFIPCAPPRCLHRVATKYRQIGRSVLTIYLTQVLGSKPRCSPGSRISRSPPTMESV